MQSIPSGQPSPDYRRSATRFLGRAARAVRLTGALSSLAAILLLSGWAQARAASAVSLPTTNVSQSSTPVAITVNVTGTGVAAALQGVTQGVAGLDFVVTDVNNCIGTSYSPGMQCTVNVVFTPKYPGVRAGAVLIKAADGSLLGSTLLSGTANGSLSVLVPGTIDTVAGDGELNYRNDGIAATQAPIFLPYGVVVDPAGNIYISDTNNNRIRRVDATTGLISTVAGVGVPGYSGDGGVASSASISQPGGLALDGAGNVYFADSGNDIIRRIDAVSGVISTVAGTPLTQNYSGDGLQATAAGVALSSPRGVTFDASGNMLIADTGNNVIRKVDASTGTISTVAGNGLSGYNGDGIAAISAKLSSPWTVAVGPHGSIYVADLMNNRVRKVSGGTITTVAGTGGRGFAGDDGPATSATLNDPTSIVLDPAGNLYIADSENNRVRKVYAGTSTIQTIIGNGSGQFTGDGGPANQATLYAPYALFLTQSGDLYLSDTLHNRIRTVAGSLTQLTYPVMRKTKISAPQSEGLENDGNMDLNLSAPTFDQAGLASDPTLTTCSFTSGLAPAGSCTLGVEFEPTDVGAPRTGALTLASDAGNSPSVINLSGQVLSVEPTTTTLTSSINPSLVSQSVVLTATVTVNDASATGPVTGPVTFLDGTTVLCDTVPLNAGTAACTVSFATLGQHSLTASYAGDADNEATVSQPLPQVVKQQPTLALTVTPNPSVVTQSVTMTVAATAPTGTPSGPVVFYDGTTALTGNIALSAGGTATFVTTQLGPGAHSLSVQYPLGDATNAPATSNTVDDTVNQATSVTTIGSSNSSVLAGVPVTLTATVSDANNVMPTGPVQFTATSAVLNGGSAVLGSGTLDATGKASIVLSNLNPGSYNITAAYSGDSNVAASTSTPALGQTIQQIPTTATLSSDANPASAGTTVHLIATVSIGNGASPDGVINGTVTFRDGSTVVGTSPVDSSGVASISVNTLLPGPHTIVASYSGNTTYATSSSTTLTQTVNSTSTTTTVSSSATSALAGEPVTFTATVASSTGIPTGNIAFQDGTVVIGHGVLNAQGIATFSSSTLPVAGHSITAVYQGDGSYNTSTSSPLTETISLATTSLALTSPVNTVITGSAVAFTATLTGNGVIPTGTLTLRDGNLSIAVQNLSATGTLSFNTSTLSVGTHTLTAVYGGDSNNSPATSSAVTITVQQAPTDTTLTTSASPSVEGQGVTFTAAVTSSATSLTGSIVFKDGGTTLGSVPLGANATAVYTTNSLAFGSHPITAVYSGDTNHVTSISPAVSEQIVHAVTIALQSGANPATAGTNVVLTARLTGVGSLIPGGTVAFNDGGATLGTVTVDSTGTATFQTSSLATGLHSITVAYSGDTNYSASVSAPLALTVQNANTQIALTSSANPANYGAPLSLSATITTNGAVATGSVTFLDGTTQIGTGVLNSSGVALLSTPSLAPGAHTLVATYPGDGKASASASGPLTISVRQVTSVAVASDGNPAQTLSPVIFTAAVTNSGVSAITGTVTFTDGTTQLGTALVDSTGHASLKMSLLAAGTHPITAAYAGDTNDFGSVSSTFSQMVQVRSTTTALTAASTDPNNPQQVTLIGIVRWTGPGVPTGIITFKNGNNVIGTSPIDGSGAATINMTLDPATTQTVSASYSGDESYGASASSSINVSGGQATQFGISVDPPSVTLQSKQHTLIHLTISSIKGFADTVQLGCLGLPSSATCTFSNVQPKLTANGTATVDLTLDTGDPLGAGALVSSTQQPSSNVLTCVLPAGLLAGFALFSRKRRAMRLLVVLIAAIVATLSITGCAGLQMTGTPPGTYTFKITASGQNTGATVAAAYTLTVTQ